MSKDIQKSSHSVNTNSGGKKLDLSKINNMALGSALANLELPRLFYQLIVFVLDASDSMTWEGITGKSKGEEIHEQIVPIIKRLQSSKNKNCFDISMIAFSQESVEFIKSKKVTEIDAETFDFNPCNKVGNFQTEIQDALELAEERVLGYFEGHPSNSQALIIVLSDGALNDQKEALEICERIKENKKVTIASYLFEDKKWKDKFTIEQLSYLQKNIKDLSSVDCNGINFFHSKVDAEEIRKHMIKSISTVSKID